MKKITTLQTVAAGFASILIILPLVSSAQRTCSAAHQNQKVPKIYYFEGDNGWKFARLTIEKKDPQSDVIDVVKIENKPGMSPLFGKNYIFTRNLAETRQAYQNLREAHIISESQLIAVDNTLTLEADGFRFKIILSGHRVLELVPILKSSGMALPSVRMTPRAGL